MSNFKERFESNNKQKHELKVQVKELLAQFHAAIDSLDRDKAAIFNDLQNEIAETGVELTAAEISDMTGGALSPQAVGQYGYRAENARSTWYRHTYTPSMPKLERRKTTVARHFVEIDDNGDIIPGNIMSIFSEKYVYHVNK